MDAIHGEVFNIILIIIVSCVGLITKSVMSYLKKKGVITKLEGHKEIANLVVGAVEQTYKHLHGKEKLNLAKIEMLKLSKEKGLKINEKELDLLIESSVKEMNKTIRQELQK